MEGDPRIKEKRIFPNLVKDLVDLKLSEQVQEVAQERYTKLYKVRHKMKLYLVLYLTNGITLWRMELDQSSRKNRMPNGFEKQIDLMEILKVRLFPRFQATTGYPFQSDVCSGCRNEFHKNACFISSWLSNKNPTWMVILKKKSSWTCQNYILKMLLMQNTLDTKFTFSTIYFRSFIPYKRLK